MNFKEEHKSHEQILIEKYKEKDINVAYSKLEILHDGFDKDGPDSCYSYEYYIYYIIDYNYYIDIWRRDNCYSEEDNEEYFLYKYKMKYIDHNNTELIRYLKLYHVY